VVDGEVFGQTVLKGVEDLWRVTVVETCALNDDVSRQCREIRSNTPCVKIVHVEDVIDPREMRAHIDEVEIVGCPLQQDAPRVVQ
jgi:hypothetical protein